MNIEVGIIGDTTGIDLMRGTMIVSDHVRGIATIEDIIAITVITDIVRSKERGYQGTERGRDGLLDPRAERGTVIVLEADHAQGRHILVVIVTDAMIDVTHEGSHDLGLPVDRFAKYRAMKNTITYIQKSKSMVRKAYINEQHRCNFTRNYCAKLKARHEVTSVSLYHEGLA